MIRHVRIALVSLGILSASACRFDENSVTTSTPAAVTGSANATVSTGTQSSALSVTGAPVTTVTAGTAYSFTPKVSAANGAALTFTIENKPAWASFDPSTGTLSGTPGAADVASYAGVLIAASDGQNSSSLPAFAITVTQSAAGTATLSWVPPTQNSDGTPLTNLAGFKVVYGTNSAALDQAVRIDNPATARYVVSDLAPGTYFFAVVAFTTDGIESPLSGLASKTI